MTRSFRILRNIFLVLTSLVVLVIFIIWRQWQIRGTLDEIDWPTAAVSAQRGDVVTATWLGITTILFDDGETQILIDGEFTRINPFQLALLQPVKSDVATINYALSTFQIDRLAAIVPVHAHFDHAMDIGHVANRTTAVILGSESAANIARGQNVPVSQYQILADGETRQFGAFTIRLIATGHAPIGPGGEEFFAGAIEEPLYQPARISAWKTGVPWSIVISHPNGTTLVNGSGGYTRNSLDGVTADVVMFGVARLAALGREYTQSLWNETVATTGASRVIVIHHDDYTEPFGEVKLFPDMLDNVVKTAGWLDEIIDEDGSSVSIELPPFGKPILLY